MSDPGLLYRHPVEALRAAFAAAEAPLFGTARPHPSSERMDGRTGYGWWTTPEKARVIAAGLRLTGYEVVILPGYSVGVVILDVQAGRRELPEQKPTYQQDDATSPSTGSAQVTP